MTATYFETQEKFRDWLEMNYNTETELLVGFYKVNSGKLSMTWSQSVDQALCFGWIDGVRRSIDKDSYCLRFTPRRANSNWSAINIKKIEHLTNAGLMKPAGIKIFNLRKENKSVLYSHENEYLSLNSIYEVQFNENKNARNFFEKQAPSYKKAVIRWIMSAVQEKTRQARLEKAIKISEKHKRLIS